MNGAKWTGLTLVLLSVVGVAVWNLAAPGPMANDVQNNRAVVPGRYASPATGSAPMADQPHASDGFLAEMWRWCQQTWGQMAGWMGHRMGDMHGPGPGMMERGMSNRW